ASLRQAGSPSRRRWRAARPRLARGRPAPLVFLVFVEVVEDVDVIQRARLAQHVADQGCTLLRPLEYGSDLGHCRRATKLMTQVHLDTFICLDVPNKGE